MAANMWCIEIDTSLDVDRQLEDGRGVSLGNGLNVHAALCAGHNHGALSDRHDGARHKTEEGTCEPDVSQKTTEHK